MVDLVRSRCSPEALAKEFPLKPSATGLGDTIWIKAGEPMA